MALTAALAILAGLVSLVAGVCRLGRIAQFFSESVLLGFVFALGVGAYGAAMASEYNSRPLVPEVLVKADQFAVVRPRPTIEQMLAAERDAPAGPAAMMARTRPFGSRISQKPSPPIEVMCG